MGSQTQLDQFRARLIVRKTGNGTAGQVELDAVYVEGSQPTMVNSQVDPAFNVNSQAKFEAGAWAVGNFTSTGQTELGGSVYVENGKATIAGGGSLKAFVQMPSGGPVLYGLDGGATEFG